MSIDLETYSRIRSGGAGFYEQKRGLIAVWGKEAVQFLDGMITNDMKTLEDGQQMLAAFPNAQGRLLSVVRILREGDRFLIETEEATREKVYNNLFRFTFAGDFFVDDLSERYRFFEVYNEPGTQAPSPASPQGGEDTSANWPLRLYSTSSTSELMCVEVVNADSVRNRLKADGMVEVSDELYETLRIENGVPKYGVDMDETTIVPELGLDGLISYNKGCYIGQEIIARIHFRGHIAKQLTGLTPSEPGAVATGLMHGAELLSPDGKNAGRITSVTYSPKLEKLIALAFVRYDYLANGTELMIENTKAKVMGLPLVTLDI